MKHEANIPREGDLHSVVTIGAYTFELRYGYCDERDRASGEPYILYPDLISMPHYTEEGYRIVTALQSVCGHYLPPDGCEPENCCYTCNYYPDKKAEIGICGCEKCSAHPDPAGPEGGAGGTARHTMYGCDRPVHDKGGYEK